MPINDPKTNARRALTLLDLTNLNDDCAEADIDALCEAASTPHGHVAAVCLWPRFVARAKHRLEGTGIRIASVVNFPEGGTDTETVVAAAIAMVEDGADEVDLVMPYRAFGEGRHAVASNQISAVKSAINHSALLKVILETGELKEPALIEAASEAAIHAGADFIKTSTGKTAVSATPEAVGLMLGAIATAPRQVGIKPSGGIRTLEDAEIYLDLADSALGPDWARPETFRFGASSLLKSLLAVLGDTGSAGTPPSGAY